METLLRDVCYGLRILLKKPGFTLVAVFTLAIGIGVNTAIFSIVNALLFKPLPVLQPDRLVTVYGTDVRNPRYYVSYPDYLYYRDRNEVFGGVLAYSVFNKALARNGQSEVVFGELVSGNYFGVLGVKPTLGRMFLPEEDEVPNRNSVAIISHSLWKRLFNSDPQAIGKPVKLNGYDFTIVGVAPAEFRGLHLPTIMAIDIWVPLNMAGQVGWSMDILSDRNKHWLQVVGRLNHGVTIERAQTAMTLLMRQLEQAYRDLYKYSQGDQIRLVPTGEVRLDPSTDERLLPTAGMLMIVVGLVLLIACTNLANLSLAHAARRTKEMAVRLALGASRGRLVRQLLTESLVLSFIGGAVGLLLAQWLAQFIVSFKPTFPIPVQLSLEVSVDLRVLIFTLAACILTGVVCGSVPALRASKANVTSSLTGEGIVVPGGRRRFGMRHWLVVPQVALSLLLVLVTGLFLRSLFKAGSIDPGFNTDQAAIISLDLELHGYERVRGGEFYRTLLQQALHLPGATSASLADRLPLEPPQNAEVYPEGRPQTDGRRFVLHFARVTPGFLKTLGISLVRGRDFTEHDTEATPRVALINEIVARRLWAGEDAIGKRLLIKTLGSKSANGQLVEVVGIVKETKVKSLNESPSGYLYLPFEQFYSARMQLIVSGRDNPAYWLERLKKLVHELDPHLAIIQRKTMSEHVGLLLYPIRISAALSAGFGFLGLLLASLGIYGVIAYSVAQRTRELGIRMALGARRADVLRLVVAEGLKVVAIGSVIGLLLAVATTRLLSSLLFGVSATDPVAFVGMPVIAGGVALLACYLPARRAIKVDPMVALRYE